jgi:hypothetical protein
VQQVHEANVVFLIQIRFGFHGEECVGWEVPTWKEEPLGNPHREGKNNATTIERKKPFIKQALSGIFLLLLSTSLFCRMSLFNSPKSLPSRPASI